MYMHIHVLKLFFWSRSSSATTRSAFSSDQFGGAMVRTRCPLSTSYVTWTWVGIWYHFGGYLADRSWPNLNCSVMYTTLSVGQSDQRRSVISFLRKGDNYVWWDIEINPTNWVAWTWADLLIGWQLSHTQLAVAYFLALYWFLLDWSDTIVSFN